MDIKHIITEAFGTAKAESFKFEKKNPELRDQVVHAKRSQFWVESLACEFRKNFENNADVRVFSKYHKGNRKDFGLNELLFDISVVKTATIHSPRHKELTYIEKALWLVESEMAKDTRQLVLDFSKLVMGDAENKLFVGPFTDEDEKIMEIFKKIAFNCKGNVWVALILHPGEWKESKLNELHLYRL